MQAGLFWKWKCIENYTVLNIIESIIDSESIGILI